jgi:hypothetical protein
MYTVLLPLGGYPIAVKYIITVASLVHSIVLSPLFQTIPANSQLGIVYDK